MKTTSLGDVTVIRETEKAIEIEIENGAGQVVKFQWVPKRCITGLKIEDGTGQCFVRDLQVATWFVAKERLWPAKQKAF